MTNDTDPRKSMQNALAQKEKERLQSFYDFNSDVLQFFKAIDKQFMAFINKPDNDISGVENLIKQADLLLPDINTLKFELDMLADEDISNTCRKEIEKQKKYITEIMALSQVGFVKDKFLALLEENKTKLGEEQQQNLKDEANRKRQEEEQKKKEAEERLIAETKKKKEEDERKEKERLEKIRIEAEVREKLRIEEEKKKKEEAAEEARRKEEDDRLRVENFEKQFHIKESKALIKEWFIKTIIINDQEWTLDNPEFWLKLQYSNCHDYDTLKLIKENFDGFVVPSVNDWIKLITYIESNGIYNEILDKFSLNDSCLTSDTSSRTEIIKSGWSKHNHINNYAKAISIFGPGYNPSYRVIDDYGECACLHPTLRLIKK